MLPRPLPVAGMTLLTVRVEQIGLKDASQFIDPFITMSVKGTYLLAVIEMHLFVAIVWVGDFIGKSHFSVLVLMMLLLLTMMMRIVMVIFILMIANGFMMTMMIFAVILLLCSSVKDDTCVCDLFLFNSPAAWVAAFCL